MLGTSRQQERWSDTVAARVGISLLILVFLVIPGFFVIFEKSRLVAYYLFYPAGAALGLWLMSRGHAYAGSLILVLSIYGVIAWISWHVGYSDVNKLKWWIIALLPWVLFREEDRITIFATSALPIIFSFLTAWAPASPGDMLPAEQEFLRQILRGSEALGAFSCIFFLRRAYLDAERARITDKQFFSQTFDAIPLPIIIKDGLSLEFVYYNEAAKLTFDLKDNMINSNQTTFAESSAGAVSKLDHEVLRGTGYHIEAKESCLRAIGLNWNFRTYRIPHELKNDGHRLLITVSESLHALNWENRKVDSDKAALAHIGRLLNLVQFRYDPMNQKLSVDGFNHTKETDHLRDYLLYYLPRVDKKLTRIGHAFTLAGQKYQLFLESDGTQGGLAGLIVEVNEL